MGLGHGGFSVHGGVVAIVNSWVGLGEERVAITIVLLVELSNGCDVGQGQKVEEEKRVGVMGVWVHGVRGVM